MRRDPPYLPLSAKKYLRRSRTLTHRCAVHLLPRGGLRDPSSTSCDEQGPDPCRWLWKASNKVSMSLRCNASSLRISRLARKIRPLPPLLSVSSRLCRRRYRAQSHTQFLHLASRIALRRFHPAFPYSSHPDSPPMPSLRGPTVELAVFRIGFSCLGVQVPAFGTIVVQVTGHRDRNVQCAVIGADVAMLVQ